MEEGVEGKLEGEEFDREGAIDSEHSEYDERAEVSAYTKKPIAFRKANENGKRDKKSSTKNGLEAIVERLKNKAKEFGVDETEYTSSYLAKNPVYAKETAEEDASDEKETWKGTVAFIYNKATGEFLLEENPPSYAIKEARGKLRLIGGQMESSDFSTLEAMVREAEEEVESDESKKILIMTLRQNGTKYTTIRNLINGRIVETDIYEIHVKPIEDWEKVKKTKLTHDAGYARVLTFDEILSRPHDFTFDHYDVLREFIYELYFNPLASRAITQNSYQKPFIPHQINPN